MPNEPGLCSGTVPFECRLFPRQPGYVMTVCAWAIDMVATKARNVRRAYMVYVSVAARGRRLCWYGLDQVEDNRRRVAEMLRSHRADRPGYAGLVAHSKDFRFHGQLTREGSKMTWTQVKREESLRCVSEDMGIGRDLRMHTR